MNTRKPVTRRDFLKLGAAGLAGAALLGVTGPAFGQTATVSATSLGISRYNTAAKNRANLVKALTNSRRSIYFPPGDYLVDNAGSQNIVFSSFGGELIMDPAARFVFTDNTRRGFLFSGGVGARVRGLRVTYRVAAPVRVGAQEAVQWSRSTDTLVRNASIENGPAAGLLFSECVRPSVYAATIRNTRADGLHFANCQGVRADGITTENTGDDGLAFLNYSRRSDLYGGLATNVRVRNSGARGIAVVGQRGVAIDGFSVAGTASSGLLCAHDGYYDTRLPSNVRFANGTVTEAGRVAGRSGNKFGIDFGRVESVAFENVEVVSPATRGVAGAARGGAVSLSNVRVKNAPSLGFNLESGAFDLKDLSATDTGDTGITVFRSASVRYRGLTATNTSKNDPARRAFNFEDNALVEGVDLRVVDTAAVPTGDTVRTSGAQTGTLGTVYDGVANGPVRMQNYSGLAAILA